MFIKEDYGSEKNSHNELEIVAAQVNSSNTYSFVADHSNNQAHFFTDRNDYVTVTVDGSSHMATHNIDTYSAYSDFFKITEGDNVVITSATTNLFDCILIY